MAELRHDRAPDQTAAQTLASDGNELRAAGAVVFIRLWTSCEAGEPGNVTSKSLDPAVCLAVDLIAASGGTVQHHGKPLIATFPDASTAILTARRMQWAFQGLSEAEGFAGTAIAALVYSSDDLCGKPASDANALPLEQAAPGKILLGEKASLLLRDLPGLATEPAADSSLSEFIWRSPGSGSGNAADELTLFRNIKEQGRKSPGSHMEEPLPVVSDSPDAVGAVFAESADLDNPFPDTPAAGFFAGLSNSQRLILGGGLAVLICICAILVAVLGSHRNPSASSLSPAGVTTPLSPQSPATQAQSSAPQTARAATAQPDGTVQTPIKVDTPAAKPAEAETPRERAKKQRENAAKESPTGSGCDGGAAGAKRTLYRAYNSLHAGKYDDAESKFKSILGCKDASAQAHAGLEEVRVKREAAR